MTAPRALIQRGKLAGLALFLFAGAARAGEDADAIPPGQEQVISQMLGQGAALPGGCTWTGASIDRFSISSRYTCPHGEVVILLGSTHAAPQGAARTEHFAISAQGGASSGELFEQIVARVRAHEREIAWRRVEDTNEPERPRQVSSPFALAMAAAAVIAAASVVIATRRAAGWQWIRKRAARRPARGVLAALVMAAAAHGVIFWTGDAIDAALTWRGVAWILLCGGLAIACAAVTTVACALRAILRAPRAAFPAVAALYVAIGYPLSLLRDAPHLFGNVETPEPGSTATDTSSARPKITYHVNELGFREPSWTVEKAPGTVRVVLIGDSYVFGIGVDRTDMLSERLAATLKERWPGRAIEVLNLGIPGDNLASHVDVYEEATTRLAPDIAVVCLTLPNDLSRWDIQTQKRAARRVSPLSFARFLAGRAALTLADYALLDDRVTPEGIAHLDAQLDRLERARRAAPGQPFTAIFAFGRPDRALGARLEAHREVPLIRGRDPGPEDFLPVDGHPTPHGNRRFAAWIADALEGFVLVRAPILLPPGTEQ